MKIEQVFNSVISERQHQDRKWGTINKHPYEVGAWLTLMSVHLSKAMANWCGSTGDAGALEEIRKVLAIGVACGEQHGLAMRPTRSVGPVELSIEVIVDYLALHKIEELYLIGYQEFQKNGVWSRGFSGVNDYLKSGCPAYKTEKLLANNGFIDPSSQSADRLAVDALPYDQHLSAYEHHAHLTMQLMPMLKLLDNSLASQGKQLSSADTGSIIQTGANLLPKVDDAGKPWQERALRLWCVVIQALCYMRDAGIQGLGMTDPVDLPIDPATQLKAENWRLTGERDGLWKELGKYSAEIQTLTSQRDAAKALHHDCCGQLRMALNERDALKADAALGQCAMHFVDRAGDVHPGIDDAETICAEFNKAMVDTIMEKRKVLERPPMVDAAMPDGQHV